MKHKATTNTSSSSNDNDNNNRNKMDSLTALNTVSHPMCSIVDSGNLSNYN